MNCPYCIETSTTLLNFLEKVEQILSILSLSDTVISKYNQLKELTFAKLNIPFTPLIKQISKTIQVPEALFKAVYLQGIKKQILIESMLDYIQNQPDDIQQYLTQLNSTFNLNFSAIEPKTIEDFDYETKVFERKLKDDFCRFDDLIRGKLDLLKKVTTSYETQIKENQNSFEKELYVLREKINKNSNLEDELFAIRKENDSNVYLIDTLTHMICNSFAKYNNMNGESAVLDCQDNPQVVGQLNHLLNVLDKCYDDNKYLSEVLPQIQKEKLEMNTELSLPYVANVVNKNNLMQDLVLDIADIEKSSQVFHKNFQELINYIDNNIKEV